MLSCRYATKNKAEANTLIFFDSGSSDNFVLDKVAQDNGYVGQTRTFKLQKFGTKWETKTTKEYYIKLKNNQGKVIEIPCFGVESIGTHHKIPKGTLAEAAKKFSVHLSDISNYYGDKEILIGRCNYGLFPTELRRDGDLAISRSQFGRPFMLLGSSKGSKTDKIVECNFIDVKDRFWESDGLGLNPDPQCSTCLKLPACKSCKLLSQPISYKEQQEAKLISNSMTFDYEKKEVRIAYPYLRNMREVFPPERSNEQIARKMAMNLKKGLIRDGILADYTDHFLDMESRGVIRELSQEEISEWEAGGNPVNYCSHHAVIRDHKNTKIRVVCNSSLSHNSTSLNNELPKGPTALSNLLHVMLRARARPYLVIADLEKAYWSVRTSKPDLHLRRFLWWRREDFQIQDSPLRVFGTQRMMFGDRISAFVLEEAKNEIARYAQYELKEEGFANQLLSGAYIDDVVPSFESKKDAEKFIKTLHKAFNPLGFKFKEITLLGPDLEPPTSEPTHIFGHLLNFQQDRLYLKFQCNFSVTRRGRKTQSDLTSQSDLTDLVLTKRNMQAVLGSQYDPMGLATPFLAKYKLFLSKLHKEYGWDESLSVEDQLKAKHLVKELITASESELSFPRANKPKDFVLKKIVAFSDGSSKAFATVLYGIYQNPEDPTDLTSSLLTSKMKIGHETVPRHELCGLLASHRLIKNYMKCIQEPHLKEISFVVDSTCILDYLSDKNVQKDVYVNNRVSEIRRDIRSLLAREGLKLKYYWVASDLNVSDDATRENCKFEFLFSEKWQNGPEFMKDLENSTAKLKHTFLDDHVVREHEVQTFTTECVPVDGPWERLMQNTNSLMKVLRVWCLVKGIIKNRRFKSVNSTPQDIQEGFRFFLRITEASSPVKELRTKQLLIFQEDGVSYTKMRFPDEVRKNVFGKDKLPVLGPRTRLAKLVLLHAHANQSFKRYNPIHNSIHQTLVNSRVGSFGCYILHARQAIKGLTHSCVICRRLNKRVQDAQMAEKKGGFGTIPEDGSAFCNLALDYFGPLYARPPKAKQTRQSKSYKIYGLAILCQQTRAIKIYVVEGYDTESFLVAFRTHCANHGVPTSILSDPMKAFVKASKTVDEEGQDTLEEVNDPEEVEQVLMKEFNIKWELIPPGSQWRDPAERAIKSIKTMMKSVFNTDKDMPVLTIGEYLCLFAEISELLNRRPIEAMVYEDKLKFICPNDLLLGRTSKDQPELMSDTFDIKRRITLLENIKEKFWKHYLNVLAGDSRLMKYPCWYSQTRRPRIGDVVLVLYKTRVSESYRVGKIDNVDETHRNLDLTVSPPQTGDPLILKMPTKMLVPIQRTILLYSPHDQQNGEIETVGAKPNDLEIKKKIEPSRQHDGPEIKDLKNKRGRPRRTK